MVRSRTDGPEGGDVRVLDDARAAALVRLCGLLVPGSGRVGPAVYAGALLDRMEAVALATRLADHLHADARGHRAGLPAAVPDRALSA